MKRQDGYLTKESGSWLGHYSRWIVDHSTGEKKRQQRAFKLGDVASMTLTEARNKLRERIVSELGVTADGRKTFGWFVENRWLPLRQGSWRESTQRVMREHVKFITGRFGTTPLEAMDAVEMQAWLTDVAKRKSGSLVQTCRIWLRSILAEALEQDYIRKNPARLLRIPKLKAVYRPYLEVEQITALLKAAKDAPRELTLLTICFVTALRPSEIFALKWKSYSREHKTLTIQETIYRGQIRPFSKTTEEGDRDHLTLHLPDAAVAVLEQWDWITVGESLGKPSSDPGSYHLRHSDPEALIFPNSDGKHILTENYQERVLKPLAKSAGIPRINFQIIRRSVATHAQSLGSPKDISVILRHRKVEMAQQNYVQAVEATVKQTTERLADKLLAKH